MVKNKLIEVCCGSIEDCIVAEKHGADRIELNHALELGGITPSVGTLLLAMTHVNIPICCMVRPRTAGFLYTDDQFESMLTDAELLLEHGADGIVFGFLTENHTIDKKRTKEMVELIKREKKEAIFHKAFDNCTDLMAAIDDLIECGVDRVLTSGGNNYPNIEKGFPILKRIIEEKKGQIEILPGGGVRAHNIKNVAETLNCTQIHMTAKSEANDDGNYTVVDADTLDAMLAALNA